MQASVATSVQLSLFFLLPAKLILSVKVVELSRLLIVFRLHVTKAANGFHHISRTFFWRTQFIRNMNKPCERKMTFKLRCIEMENVLSTPSLRN